MPTIDNQYGDSATDVLVTHLTLVKHFLAYFILQSLWWLRLLENLVLSKREQTFEDKLSNGETKNQLFPRETWSIEKCRQALYTGISRLLHIEIQEVLPAGNRPIAAEATP